MTLSSPELDEIRDGPVTLADPVADPDRLDAWLEEHRKLHSSTDLKAAAAFFLGSLVYEIAEPLVRCLMEGGPTNGPDPPSARIRLGGATWDEDGGTGRTLTCRVAFLEGAARGSGKLGPALVALHEGLIGLLHRRRGWAPTRSGGS